MRTKRKILLRAFVFACLSLTGFYLYAEFLSEEGRFKRDVIGKLTSLQQGKLDRVFVTSFESDWKLVCHFNSYQGGGQHVGGMDAVSSWIHAQASWTLDDMPMAWENYSLLVFGSNKNLVAIKLPRKQFNVRASNTEIFNKSCWMKPEAIEEKLRFEAKPGSIVIRIGDK